MTGWAVWSGGVVQSGQCDFDQFIRLTQLWFERGHVDEVATERYTITAETLRKSRQTDALEVIGWLRGMCTVHSKPFKLQAPGDAKRFSSDARLEMIGWLKRPLAKWDHANDAARHLLLYLVTTRQMEPPRV